MIIVGYQGIGKSTLCCSEKQLGYIDLESSNFFVDGKRDDNWYKIYCNIAMHLSQQGYRVFMSSHEVVRKELSTCKERKVIICPSQELRDQWVARLGDRYLFTELEKDYKAWQNAVDRYDENISELLADENFEHYIIKDMNYMLRDIFNRLDEQN